jgi:hypothetical protein
MRSLQLSRDSLQFPVHDFFAVLTASLPALVFLQSSQSRYIARLDRINLPTRKAFIRDTSNLILQARASRAEQANPPTVGKKWVDKFIRRYKYNIIPSHVLDANRHASENPEAINTWFLKYKMVVSEHGIVADDI